MAYRWCQCSECGGHIEYPAEDTGQTTACPHCQQQTRLFWDDKLAAPPIARPPDSPPNPSRPTHCRKLRNLDLGWRTGLAIPGVLLFFVLGTFFADFLVGLVQ